MPLPSLGLLRLTPPDIKDVGVNSGTGDLSERVRRYHANRERRVFLGAEIGNVQMINDNVGRLNIKSRNDQATRRCTWQSTPLPDAVEALLVPAPGSMH